jgi:multidrug efflux pump subunit AcrA (membrane-fusion protein)
MGKVHMPLIQSDAVYLLDHGTSDVLIRRNINGVENAWQARFSRLEGVINQKTRVINAVIEIDNPYEQSSMPLVFGAFVEVEIKGAPIANAALIPQLAIHAQSLVYVYDEGVLRKKTVELVHSNSNGSAVVLGLNEGDQLVTNRLELMYESMPVAVQNEQ